MVVPLPIKAEGSLKPKEPPPMKKKTKSVVSAQAVCENQNDPHAFLTLLRDAMREIAERMFAEEINQLCGPSHYPLLNALYRRAGSETGVC